MSETYLPIQTVPFIKAQKLGRIEVEGITVKLTPQEWDICDEVSKNYWSSKKGGVYGKGIINTEDDKTRVERVGLLGEMAFAKISGLPMNVSYKEQGDDYDFRFDGGTIDVKNASRLPPYKQMLVFGKHGNNSKPLELKSDYFVSSFLAFEDRDAKKATIIIVGFCTKDELLSQGLVRARAKKCSHYNYERHYRDLHPISELLTMINPELETITIKPEEEESVQAAT